MNATTFHEDWYPADRLALLASLAASTNGLDGDAVEVGCWEGKSTIAIAQAIAPGILHAVDWWQGDVPGAETPRFITQAVATQRDVYAVFLANVRAATAGNVCVHRQDWREFEPPSALRFAHIDATHSEREVADNIAAFLPRLVPGAVLCGDDYGCQPVRLAVDAALLGAQATGELWFWRVPA